MTSAGRNLWGKDVPVLIARLEDVLKLNEAYQEDYRLTKESLGATPSAKQFNFDDAAIFGRMDLYCRRVIVSARPARRSFRGASPLTGASLPLWPAEVD